MSGWHRALASVAALGVTACGGQTASSVGPPADSGADAASASEAGALVPTFFALVRADNGLCLPQQFLQDSTTGEVDCRIFFVLPSGNASCVGDGPGLSLPDSPTILAVRSHESLDPSRPVCELAQLPESAWMGTTCAASSQAGWCYVAGPAAGPNCPQALRFSASAAPPAGAMVLLACP